MGTRNLFRDVSGIEDRHWWFVARRKFIRRILNHFFPLESERKILELGCGTGGNLELLSNYGNVYATELDDEARQMANSRGICLVEKGSLPDDIPFREKFDLICLLDVLEHVDDDLSALKTIEKRLDARGKLLITVPAYKFMWSAHDVALHHKRRYLKKQLNQVVQAAGFKKLYSTYYNTSLFPLIAAARFLNNIWGKQHSTDVSMPPNIINNILMAVFSSERFIMPRISLPFGVSILLVAEKMNLEKSDKQAGSCEKKSPAPIQPA